MKKIITFLTISFYLNTVSQTLCFNPHSSYTVAVNPQAIINADFNGDGNIDLATADYNSGSVSILLGTGNGGFSSPTTFATGWPHNAKALTSGDFNGDGILDLVVVNDAPASFSILIGTGTGSFYLAVNTSYTYSGAGANPRSIISGKFNSDSLLDIAIVNQGSNNVSVLFGNGTGTFGVSSDFIVGTSPYMLCSADFDNDGKSDFAVANRGSNNISVLLNLGSGNFSNATNFATSTYPTSVICADFNLDGKIDLAVGYDTSNVLSVLLGLGNGNFNSFTSFPTNTKPASITSIDFNEDGYLDLATASLDSANISILLGNGNGNFGTAAKFLVDSLPISITNADFNGDGKFDLATVNGGPNNTSILLNCTPTPTCVAFVTDSIYNISTLNWGILPHYSPQVTSAIWHWGDGTSTSGLYPSHTYTTSGWYNICVTVYTSCGDSASSCRNDTLYKMANNNSMVNVNVVSSTNSISQISNNSNIFSVYPNPTSDQFFIETNTIEKLNAELFDVNGRHVFSKSVRDKENINVSSLDKGTYTLTIKTADRVINKKVVILR